MAEKSSPRERVVLGYLTIALASLGVVGVSVTPIDLRGRPIPPHPALAMLAGVGALAAFVACFVFAVRYFGAKPGVKLVLSNLAAAVLIVTGAGAVVGVVLRSIFGPAMMLILPVTWAAGVYGTYWFARREGSVYTGPRG